MFRERHGNHVTALQMIVEGGQTTTSGRVLVGSWSLDHWTALPIAFYATRLGLQDRLEYVPRLDVAQRVASQDAPVDWALEVTQPCAAPPAPSRALPAGGPTYVLKKSFAVCGPSGMSWYLYARSVP
jgi:hypothetical protein